MHVETYYMTSNDTLGVADVRSGVTCHLLLRSGLCKIHVLPRYLGGTPEKGVSFIFTHFFSKVSQKKLGKSFEGKLSPCPLHLERAADDKETVLLFFSLSKAGRGKRLFGKAKTSQQLLRRAKTGVTRARMHGRKVFL